MSTLRLLALFLLGPLLVVTACMAERPCYSVIEAPAHAGKEICLKAHVYDIENAPNGDRYLDVCPSEGPADACGFTVLSLAQDRASVGSLETLEGQDIALRATVHSNHAGGYMLLSAARQLHGGAERFQPNPELAHGFSAGSGITAFRDPAMSSHHRRTTAFTSSATAAASDR